MSAVGSKRLGRQALAFFTAMSFALSLIAVAGPLSDPASANHGNKTLDVTPDAATNTVGDVHILTATLSAPADNGAINIDFEIDCIDGCRGGSDYVAVSGGAGGNINEAPVDGNQAAGTPDDTRTSPDLSCQIPEASDSCTVSYTRNSSGSDEIFGFVDEGGDNNTANDDPNADDTVTKQWDADTATRLDCDDESGNDTETNPVVGDQSDEVYICTAQDASNNPIPGVSVHAENLDGANDCDDSAAGPNADRGTADPTACMPDAIGESTGADCAWDATNANGQCNFIVSPADGETGPADICFWISNDGGDDEFAPAGSADDGGDCNAETVGEAENNDQTDKVTKTWVAQDATSLDCTPDTDTNPTGTQHLVTCQVADQFGQAMQSGGDTVDVEFLTGSPNDPQGDDTAAPPDFDDLATSNSGQVTIQYQGTNTGTDTICAWLDADNDSQVPDEGDCGEAVTPDDTDDTDVVEKTWTSGQEQRLDCEPETAANHQTLDHEIDCQIVDEFGGALSTQGVQVKVEIQGANDPDNGASFNTPDRTCNTDANGFCSVNHDPTANNVGETTYTAWIGTDHDLTEGQNEVNQPGSNFQEPDNTDVMTKTWHGDATTLTQTPNSDAAALGTCNVFTVTITDAQQRAVGNVIIDVLQTHEHFNDGNAATADADLSFCDQAEVIAADANAPNPSGVTPLDAAGATSQEHGETDEGTDANGQVSYGIKNDNDVQGDVEVLAFCDNTQVECVGEDNDDAPDVAEIQDISTKTWGAGGADGVEDVVCTPETDTNPNGTQHDFACTLTNANDSPVPGVTPVADVVAGPNQNEPGAAITCGASNQQGVSLCSYNDSGASPIGTDTIEVWVQQSAAAGGGSALRDAGEPFDEISKTWATPPTGLGIDLTCDDTNGPTGVAALDTDTAVENSIDCFNQLSDGTETFTAAVFNPNGNSDPTDDTPVSGVQVAFEIQQGPLCGFGPCENPQDIGFTPAAGPDGDGPVFCTTAANGTCSVTVTNPTPTDGDFVLVDASVFGQTAAGFGNNSDRAGKQWVTAQGAFSIELTPQGATNQTGSSHTVTATVRGFFGNPLPGVNVDFRVNGPRNTVGAAGNDKVTDANGQATFTYTDTGPVATDGMDDIQAWIDDEPEDDMISGTEPVDTAVKFWKTQLQTTTTVKLDMENANCPDVNDDPDGFADDDDPATGNDEGFTEDAQANGVNNPHAICAVAYDENNLVIVDGSITFTITDGPGFFRNQAGDNLGTTVTVPVTQEGVAFALVNSAQAGNMQVTASKDGQSDVGVKPWFSLPPRNLDCEPETGLNEPGDPHEVECTATDRQGNPVPGWQVFGTESGPGSLQQTGGIACDPLVTGDPNTCIQVTDENGVAPFVLQNNGNTTGTQTFTAELNDNNNSSANPTRASANPAVDECERPVDNPAGAPAGNCTDAVEKDWQTDVDECSDGEDNDDDGLIDFPDDPGCATAEDDDESDDVEPPLERGPCQGFSPGTENEHPAVSGRIIVGTEGSDILAGTAGDDIICGLDGNDIIVGGSGDDLIVGNQGNDTIEGNGGKDNINGNRDNDTVDGNRKNDVIRGSKGDDTLRGNRGHDTARGGGGADTLQGGKGDDLLRGGGGGDTLKGFTGDDILNGGGGNDTCRPGRGNDRVRNCEN